MVDLHICKIYHKTCLLINLKVFVPIPPGIAWHGLAEDVSGIEQGLESSYTAHAMLCQVVDFRICNIYRKTHFLNNLKVFIPIPPGIAWHGLAEDVSGIEQGLESS